MKNLILKLKGIDKKRITDLLPFVLPLVLILISFSYYVLSEQSVFIFQEARQWQIASDQEANLILFWDDDTDDAPSGWTCISCSVGNDFYQRFIRGWSSYGSPSGSLTHTHSNPGTLTSDPRVGTGVGDSGSADTAGYPPLFYHEHNTTISDGLIGTNVPEYRNLKVIRASGVPNDLPAGVIALFDGSIPSGWTELTSYQDGKYIRGESTANVGITEGSNTHTHTIVLASPTGGGGVSNSKAKSDTGPIVAAENHTHNVSSSGVSPGANPDHQPPYITVILAKKNDDGPLTPGMIAMFDNAPSLGWENISGSGSPFYGKFFKPTDSYGTTRDVSSHSHASFLIYADGPNTTVQIRDSGTTYSSNIHKETFVIPALNTVSHFPPYNNVIVAKKEQPATRLNQSSFRWRNDDGGENNATWIEDENTSATNIDLVDTIRLRLEVEETAGEMTSTINAQVEFSTSTTNCLDGSWIVLNTSTSTWVITASENITNGTSTTNQLTSSTKSFVAGRIFDTQNQDTTGVDLNNTHTEWEWSIAGNDAQGATTYYFRATDAGTPFDNYTNCAQLTTESISVSGYVYANDKTTTSTDGLIIHLAINSQSIATTTASTSTGQYIFTNVEVPATSTPITVFIDDTSSGATITRYLGNGNISNLDIFIDHVSLGHDDSGPITNQDISHYTTSTPYTVSAGPSYILEVDTNHTLLVLDTFTYQPGGNIFADYLTIDGTLNAGSNTIEILGGGTPVIINGTFNAQTSVFRYNSGEDTVITNSTYYNLELINSP